MRELAVHLQNRKGRRVDIKASTLYGIALMSLYRRGLPIWAENDVRVLNREHSRAPTSGSAAEAVPRPQAADAPLDWTPRRRAKPADILLPMTRRWIESGRRMMFLQKPLPRELGVGPCFWLPRC